mgnify:CR=1 FL=1
MRDKDNENGAAKMAWELFEKTGSISYYMLYYDILRKKWGFNGHVVSDCGAIYDIKKQDRKTSGL